jgi:hypothetical protein
MLLKKVYLYIFLLEGGLGRFVAKYVGIIMLVISTTLRQWHKQRVGSGSKLHVYIFVVGRTDLLQNMSSCVSYIKNIAPMTYTTDWMRINRHRKHNIS